MNVVWSTTPEHARALESATPEDFAAAVNEALRTEAAQPGPTAARRLLGHRTTTGPFQDPPFVTGWAGAAPKSFPLRLQEATRYVRERVALVGDAAHAVHPLAGQGVNLGMQDAECLVRALEGALAGGFDLGDQAFLEREYQRPRLAANRLMAGALDGLQRLFSVAPDSPVATLRGLGLDVVDASGAVLKHRILKVAMGDLHPLEAPFDGLRQNYTIASTVVESMVENLREQGPVETLNALGAIISGNLPGMGSKR